MGHYHLIIVLKGFIYICCAVLTHTVPLKGYLWFLNYLWSREYKLSQIHPHITAFHINQQNHNIILIALSGHTAHATIAI